MKGISQYFSHTITNFIMFASKHIRIVSDELLPVFGIAYAIFVFYVIRPYHNYIPFYLFMTAIVENLCKKTSINANILYFSTSLV